MHVKKGKKKSWPVFWRNEALSVIFSPCCMGALRAGAQETSGPDTWAINSERPPVPCFRCCCSGRPSCPHRPCPFSLAAGTVIGVADSCLPGCLKLPSCALCRCSTSQHYCSCWAFFLKSFPAVSWYGKPLKLAPDCSVYFVLDKRQNTIPAAHCEEGGSRGWGIRGHKQGLLQKIEFPDKTMKRHKGDAITSPAFTCGSVGWLSSNFGSEHISFQKRIPAWSHTRRKLNFHDWK